MFKGTEIVVEFCYSYVSFSDVLEFLWSGERAGGTSSSVSVVLDNFVTVF